MLINTLEMYGFREYNNSSREKRKKRRETKKEEKASSIRGLSTDS